LPKWPSGLP